MMMQFLCTQHWRIDWMASPGAGLGEVSKGASIKIEKFKVTILKGTFVNFT